MSMEINLTAQQIQEIQAKAASGQELTAEEQEVLFQLEDNDWLDTVTLSNSMVAEDDVVTEETAATDEEVDSSDTDISVDASTVAQSAVSSGSVPTDEEIEALVTRKEVNEAMIERLQDQIKEMVEEVREEIEEAIEEQEEIQEEQKEEIENIIAEQLKAYEEANGEMTLEEFQSNVTNAISSSNSEATRALEKTVSTIMKANTKLNIVDALLINVKELAEENISLDSQIEAGRKAQEEAAAAAAAAAEAAAAAAAAAEESSSSSKKSCDPISFTVNNAQYDFIVDDGAFDSANDFLGAQNYFEAMKALDTDGDNKVTRDELEAGNIKLVETKDGNQSVIDVANIFDMDDFVDLSSYEDLTGVEDAKNTIANGSNSVTLGTFGLTLGENNNRVDGVSTLDAEAYLKETYGFEDDMTMPAMTEMETPETSTSDNEYLQFVEEYSQMAAELRSEIERAFENMGFTADQISAFTNISKAQGDADAKVIAEEIKEAAEAELEKKKADEKGAMEEAIRAAKAAQTDQ